MTMLIGNSVFQVMLQLQNRSFPRQTEYRKASSAYFIAKLDASNKPSPTFQTHTA